MSELFISFLPYGIGMSFLIIIFWIIKVFLNKRKIVYKALWLTISFIYTLPLIRYIAEYKNIYYSHTELKENNNIEYNNIWISFLYANIYYKNNDISSLIEQIQSRDPDIILLVEYTKAHNEMLTKIIKEKYPYMSRYVGWKGYDWDVIYSKYPVEKIKHWIYPWSFSHVSISYKEEIIDFALIHTSAPVSKHFFNMRNEQIKDLSGLMSEYYKNNDNKKNIILLWDFNLTPWSFYYKDFNSNMNNIWLYNITNNILKTNYNSLVPYTRCHQEARMFCSHIDHIRSNNNNMILEKVSINWSDHYWFFWKI